MSFGHGKDTLVYVNGYDLTGYLKSVTPKASCDVADVTTFADDDKKYIAGMKDGSLSAEGFFDGAADAIQAVLSPALGSTTLSVWSVYPQGAAVGATGLAAQAIETSYQVDSVADAAVGVSAEAQGTGGLDSVKSHHALSAETSAGNGTIVDGGAATTAGAAAYLHATDITGTNIVVIIQHSSTSDFSSDVSTLLSFTSVTADRTAEKVQTAAGATVKRYTRASWSGTFTSATFQVGLRR